MTDLGVVDGQIDELISRVSIATDCGVNMVQIRAPELNGAQFDRLVATATDALTSRTMLAINPSTRAIKRYEGIDGIQLSEHTTATTGDIRALYGDRVAVGRSVHDVTSARRCVEAGVDFLVLGTIYPSDSHPGQPTHGVEIIERVSDFTKVPVIGIGGINHRNAGEVIGRGASGIAVIRSILGTPDAAHATRQLRAIIDDAYAAQC